MKPYRLILPLALALTALAVGSAASPAVSADGTCAQRTNVYFYTTDTQDPLTATGRERRLVRRLLDLGPRRTQRE